MDNLPAHKPARVRELIEVRGCQLIYLPASSADLNPIEEAFSKVSRRCYVERELVPRRPCWRY